MKIRCIKTDNVGDAAILSRSELDVVIRET
mgnify:CR=1 FL=1